MHRPITKTLLYSDIFDYPLTLDQIHSFLITPRKVSREKVLKELEGSYQKIKGYYFLEGREEIVETRIIREKESIKKIRKTRRISNFLKLIPGIKLLGISGSLSMRNAEPSDDIDLFIITSRNQIWTSRLAAVLILKALGVYRSKNDKNSSDKFCLNMIIDEENLSFPKSRQDIYSAHELIQLLPLFQRGDSYIRFIKENDWIGQYMANFETPIIHEEKYNLFLKFLWDFFQILGAERISKEIQLKYMREKSGRETMTRGFLAFHPNDPRKRLLNAYNSRLKRHRTRTLGH